MFVCVCLCACMHAHAYVHHVHDGVYIDVCVCAFYMSSVLTQVHVYRCVLAFRVGMVHLFLDIHIIQCIYTASLI